MNDEKPRILHLAPSEQDSIILWKELYGESQIDLDWNTVIDVSELTALDLSQYNMVIISPNKSMSISKLLGDSVLTQLLSSRFDGTVVFMTRSQKPVESGFSTSLNPVGLAELLAQSSYSKQRRKQ